MANYHVLVKGINTVSFNVYEDVNLVYVREEAEDLWEEAACTLDEARQVYKNYIKDGFTIQDAGIEAHNRAHGNQSCGGCDHPDCLGPR